MMEKNKNFLKFNKEDLDFGKMKNSIAEFFFGHSELLFMIFFTVMAVMSGLLIYRHIYSSTWSDEKKEAYLQELKKGEVEFNINDFNSVVERSKEKNILYHNDINKDSKVRDIFGIEN